MSEWCICACMCIPLLAEVSCRDVIKQARVTRVASSALKQLGRVNPKNSERDCHAVFRKYGQSLPVPISKMDLDSKKNFPYVKMSAWLTYLVQYDLLEHLVGCRDIAVMQATLKRFWSLYRNSNPDHMMYHGNAGAPLCPEMTIPVVQHGDEGRSLKRKQIMVVSTTGVLGHGSSHCPGLSFNDVAEDANPLSLNMVGHTWLTHYLHGVLPINLYNETPESFSNSFLNLLLTTHSCSMRGLWLENDAFLWHCWGSRVMPPTLPRWGGFTEISWEDQPDHHLERIVQEFVTFALLERRDLIWIFHMRSMEPSSLVGCQPWVLNPHSKMRPHFWTFRSFMEIGKKGCSYTTSSTIFT